MLQHSALKYNLDFNSSLNYSASGVYTSNWFDTQSQGLTVLYDEYVATQVVPTDANISYEVRANNDKSETAWGTSLAAASGRFVQFRATLGKKESGTNPALQKMELKPNAKGQENTINLVVNPSFEDWSAGLPVGWSKGSDVTLTQVAGYNGVGSGVRFTSANGAWTANTSLRTTAVSFESGKTYTFSMKIKRVSGVGSFSCAVSNIGNPIFTTSDVTGNWIIVSGSVVASSTVSRAVEFYQSNGTAVWEIDELQVEQRAFMSEYTEGTRLAKTIMIEEGSTNLLTYSQEIDNAAWTKWKTTISANATYAPDGTLTADKLVDSTDSDLHFIRESAAASGTTYTLSFYAKKAELSWVWADVGGSGDRAYFNIETGVVGNKTAGVSSSEIKHVGNGWYRCSLTAVADDTAFNIGLANAELTPTYTGTGTQGVYLWGIQAEAKAYPTSYIHTTSATATRNAESMTISNPLRPDRGTFIIRVYVDGDKIKAAPANNYYLFGCRSSSSNADLFAGKLAPIVNAIQFYYAGSSQSVSWTNTPTEGWYVYGFRWDSTEVSIWCNGVKRSLRTTPTLLTDLNETLFIGSLDTAVYQWNGSIDSFYAFREALSDSEMATYTSLT